MHTHAGINFYFLTAEEAIGFAETLKKAAEMARSGLVLANAVPRLRSV
jgi:hypothetical protein